MVFEARYKEDFASPLCTPLGFLKPPTFFKYVNLLKIPEHLTLLWRKVFWYFSILSQTIQPLALRGLVGCARGEAAFATVSALPSQSFYILQNIVPLPFKATKTFIFET